MRIDLRKRPQGLELPLPYQWKAEAAIRRLNDPYPLPVSWAPADASLTDSWDSLVKQASSRVGVLPPSPPSDTWAAGPEGLAGTGGDLVTVLARVPTGRLVVLGEPGAGKTMLMVRLVVGLLALRAKGGPVPILAAVASWNPADRDQDLRGWLVAQLVTDYPALAAPPPPGMQEPTQAAALLASGLILPVLDGLDEIPEAARGSAISDINDALRAGEQLVVTCRSQQYRDAVRPEGGVEVTLRGAAAVQLLPLDADAVRGYFCDAASGPETRARWDPVLAVLGTDTPTGQALVTPLMVGLARAIYNPRPGELAGALRDPAELCDRALADRRAVESLLFDAFIPAAYRDDPAGRPPRHPWQAHQAQPWLEFLADYLEQTIQGTAFAWWQLTRAIPRSVVALTAGLAAGLTFGLTAFLVAGLGPALAAGLAGGLAAALVAGIVPPVVARFNDLALNRPRDEPFAMAVLAILVITGFVCAAALAAVLAAFLGAAEITASLAAGLVTGLAVGLAKGLASADDDRPASAASWRPRLGALLVGLVFGVTGGLVVGLTAGRSAGLAGGVAVGLAAAAAAGWHDVPGDNASAPTPETALASDRHAALGPMLSYGLAAGLPAGLAAGLSQHPVFGLPHGLAAGLVLVVATGFPFGLFYGPAAVSARWLDWALARSYLALYRRMPWRPMAFLEDAHARGVMRQAGPVYQFRHLELQRRLAYRRRLGAVSRRVAGARRQAS